MIKKFMKKQNKKLILMKQNKLKHQRKVSKVNKKKTSKKKKGSKGIEDWIKGGFLSNGTGLYKDKKLDSELTVDERNAKNLKQIEDMGLKDATENPLYTWERPKQSERKQQNNDNNQ